MYNPIHSVDKYVNILYNPKQYANLSFSLTITFAFSLCASPMTLASGLAIGTASFVLRVDPNLL